LMYHRIAEGGTDPFSLCVRPKNFAEQLEVLRRHALPIPLQELVAALRNGNTKKQTVVITFDDGYADNLYNAKPLLETHKTPATVFLTTGYIGGHREFWWDELDRIMLQPGQLQQTLRLKIKGCDHQWDLEGTAYYSKEDWERNRTWTVSEKAPTTRHATYFAIWQLLQFLEDNERRNLLDELLAWAELPAVARSTHRQISAEEMTELTRGELLEVGAHTVTHPVLSSLPLTIQRNEILQSKARIEEILKRPVMSFAYPFGSRPDYTAETVSILREAGFASACSTIPSPVEQNVDLYQLPRLQVQDWNGDEFAHQLSAWLNA